MTTINLLSWNVNGIRAISKKGFLEWMDEEPGEIVCIQETKAQIDQLPDKITDIKKYNSYFNSAERKGYSGVGTYSKIEPNSVEKGLNIKKFDNEGRVLRCDYDDFILLNIYYPNGGMSEERLQYKLDFYDAFLDYSNHLRDQGNNLIICGDLNTAHKEIDIARPKENEHVSGFLAIERQWIDKFLSNGYIDTFRMFNNESENYTWWSYRTKARNRNVGWRLDYFFVNEEFKDNVKNSYILSDIMGSDHCPIGVTISLP
ncbi:exodeoxyribonuclease III [Methanobrevibacter filiformis]|uniref:Exodeoxyribonuclease n=1 Tax=Methanobrevibacter filiformis TaxID=55758 RepID=A0A166DAQ9_9EURY|nr:exodeoxyribonuclease III [Methanobrevibacter filiformis]KZX15388.1 exodeoxyribonuclease [Methanobrevibacter filiformis]